MKIRPILMLMLLLSFIAVVCAPARSIVGNGRITVRVTGLNNDRGQVKIYLFNKKDGFPRDLKKAYRSESVPVAQRMALITFSNVPHGKYTIVAYNDENGNSAYDGLPVEGLGFSRSPRKKIAQVKWDDAVFSHETPNTRVYVNIRYE